MKLGKTTSTLLAASILSGCIIALPVSAEAGTPFINITFDEGGSAYTVCGATLDESSYGRSLSTATEKYAEINDVSAVNSLEGDFTFAILLHPSNNDQWTRAYDIGSGTDSYIFLAPSSSFGTGKPRFVIKSAATKTEQALEGTAALNVGEWNSVIVTRNGAVTKMYINGALAGETTDITYAPKDAGITTNNWLGRSQYGADPYFTGLIDDFRVYGSAVDADFAAEYDGIARSYELIDQAAKKKQLIYDNNCFIAETHFYSDGDEVFALGSKPSAVLATSAADGIAVSDKQITSSTASFKLIGAKDKDVSGITAYAAVYSDNILKSVNTKPITVADITSDIVDITIPITVSDGETAKLFVWDVMKPIPETDTPATDAPATAAPAEYNDITAVCAVKNYTASSGTVTAQVYSIAENGAENAINGAARSAEFDTLDEKDITITVPGRSIPSDTAKLVVKLTTPNPDGSADTAEAAALYGGIAAPVAAPADSNTTTYGAHDPSIVKFPDDETYYVYSSHHLLFTSEDLVNWRKYDFTNINAKDMSPKSHSFISSNYANTTMNGTYWAPDVIYVPDRDAEHPYWMYISLSCGLGGRNSVISLIKSDNPMFWADSNSDIVDMGVVFATKETNSYKTNAIDANIYTDTDGTTYFIWGSFWGGIQAAKLKADGFVEGVNYTSDSTILSSCQNFGTSIFTQKRGVAGPEGAWMHEHGEYRYLFTSYAWLGSNYNTRVARSPIATGFGTSMSTQLLDANGVVMGSEYNNGSTSNITGYKLIGSYRLGDGSMNIKENDVNDWYYPRESGDAHIYYGPGHNSVITADNGETFYVSHTRKDAVEGAATLQVRKLLYTADGWPVVSPVTYAGETEQRLPEEMLLGTYDLASVGVTKFAPGETSINENWTNHSGNRNYDLPVISSKVTLNPDHSMSDGLGTWSYDGDHTVTLTFTKDGDTAKDEYYKSGDVMTLYALYGYDKDEAEPVIGLTGTDQKHVTQLAKKSAACVYRTAPRTLPDAEAITIAKSAGGNPELGFDADGGILYAGDPAATVIGDTVYLICGHDTATDEAYKMPEWVLYTSKNMTDWEYKGVVMSATDVTWRSDNTSAWASQMVGYNGKYYLYFCTWDKTSSGKQSIGVAVADKPEGPYRDALGKPLVSGTFTAPESSSWNDIDPTVLIDTAGGEEHRYLAWGNGKYYICELNEDMTSVKDIDNDGSIVMHKDIKERRIKSMGGGVYTEAPWLYKRDGRYYMFYAMNWREEMAYAMCDTPMGRYDFKQIIMPPTATSNTNHPSVIDFNGKTYFIYHNGALPHGSGFRRSVAIDELKFDENGYVYPITETSIGLTGTASVIKTADNKYLGHDNLRNPLPDNSYPLSLSVTVKGAEDGYTTAWEIMPAKAAPDGANADNYVSIQSVDKPGLYISVYGGKVVLTQDTDGGQGTNMTFKTVKGLDGKDSVSFESVSEPGKYLTALDKSLTLSYGSVPEDASFTIGAATAKPETVINIADIEEEPDPEADITESFDKAAARLIYLNNVDTPAYTALNGVTLYIGTRGSGGDQTQNFSIASGGVSGNALVLNAGNYQSASRGPRMAIYTPVIPDGHTVTAELKVKQGKSGSVLRYNDSTTDEAGTNISALSESWQTFRVTITNDSDTYTRTIYLGDTVLATDFISTFPVLWGTTENKTGQSIYFDELTIKTTNGSGETPTITLPDAAAVFGFDGNLTDAIGNGVGTLTGSTVSAQSTAEAAYVTGASGAADDKAISFTGSGSYGVSLPIRPSGKSYTISFDAKITASTQYSPFVFMVNYDGAAIKGGDDNAQWISIAPQGWQGALSSGPMIWSRNVPGGAAWNDLYTAGNNSLTTGAWHNITVTANGTEGRLYVDKTLVATGAIANIIDNTTRFYLGVNAWDAPFNGAIDNLMLFNKTLSASQVALIGEKN